MYELYVYLLDLCILSYHLHAQTLIFPLDPYYEFSKEEKRRAQAMDALRVGFQKDFVGASAIHGPASCQGTGAEGWHSNDTVEPIFSDYKRIYPWRPSFTRPDGKNEPWIVYNTPSEITNKIGKVWMARYSRKKGPYHDTPEVEFDLISSGPPGLTGPAATDLLYCFEGGTGAVHGDTTQKQYAAWSMMGFVLAHQVSPPDPAYDVYIVFRGSRSGQLRPGQAGWKQEGNPDWVTDLQLAGTAVKELAISIPGKCVTGFSESLKSMLLTVMKSLEQVHNDKKTKPRCIYVTGHSLGGALASLFTAAVMLGDTYNPKVKKHQMPKAIELWPWDNMKLVTFSSPSVGNRKFQISLDTACLGKRVYVKGDIVTKEVPMYLSTVGESFTLAIPKELQAVATLDKAYKLNPHEPLAVRRSLLRWLREQKLNDGYSADLDGIPMTSMDNEPWKLFPSAKSMLDNLAKGRPATELQPLIPDCEGFLVVLLKSLSAFYKPRHNAEINRILTEIERLASSVVSPYDKVVSLCKTFKSCEDLPEKDSLYTLIGLCLFFNGVSKDPTVYTDPQKYAKVGYLIELLTRM